MMNLDEFAAALSQVTGGIARQAVTHTQTNAVVQAAASGGEAAARQVLEGMSTADLQRIQQQLQR
ncbi:hypothetical protein DT019_27205 [Streptomyces sp. SDr-06]|uniref:hypothetical protein n=1 Tax=Streptomyces sp. SDr-06 TaxID=2267702 RepID=UPI000DEA349B|nr:hypothetical protein [Streptomyces sp. SDr-06]RCH65485.1 hypothetical protein DT019_27205 [Streptomyces sp. SDr-06]